MPFEPERIEGLDKKYLLNYNHFPLYRCISTEQVADGFATCGGGRGRKYVER
jgi:hypothetical protein